MTVLHCATVEDLVASGAQQAFEDFCTREEHTNFFQSPAFLEFIRPVPGLRPVLFIALDDQGAVQGSLLGVYHRDGAGLKSWLSRRLLVQGGPLGQAEVADRLITALLNDAAGQAIYVEFRNFSDTASVHTTFQRHGFTLVPHLNFLLEVKGEEDALKTLSGTRRREIRGSVAAGASYGEATTDQEVVDLYAILVKLYREKVRKPLPPLELFRRLHTSPHGRVFVVRHQGRVVGGSAGPVYKDRVIYYWYACGDNSIKGVHASVLATWAPIEHAARNGIKQLDFMGAGKPGQGYGVHDFKARFGGTEVAFGRYEKVLNRPLYRLGVAGLKAYQGAKALLGAKR